MSPNNKNLHAQESENGSKSGLINDEFALQGVADIQQSEQAIQQVLLTALSGENRPLFNQHLFIFGIAKRTISQSSAFRQMIDSKNGLVAASLVRLQLDTVLRLYAIFWVDNAEVFATQLIEGHQIDRMKASDGQLMKDSYLRSRLARRNPWIDSVYSTTSGFIHFSKQHIVSALSKEENALPGEIQMRIGPRDNNVTIGYYNELIRAFRHMNGMIAVAMEDALLRIDGRNLD